MEKNDFYYENDWIRKLESEIHWRSYWRQQFLIKKFANQEDRLLEIGVGSSFCTNYLRSRGYSVTTLDIDRGKNPDIVANICTDYVDYNYDVILAFEIFEHIPFKCFGKVLHNISEGETHFIIMSVPEKRIGLFDLRLKFLNKSIGFGVHVPVNKLPGFLRKRCKLWKAHNWEINYSRKYSFETLEGLFLNRGFTIAHCFKSKINNHVFLC